MQNIPQTPPDHIRERIEKFVSLVIKNGEGFIDYTRERQGNSGEVLFLNEGQPWNDYFNFQLYHLRNFGQFYRDQQMPQQSHHQQMPLQPQHQQMTQQQQSYPTVPGQQQQQYPAPQQQEHHPLSPKERVGLSMILTNLKGSKDSIKEAKGWIMEHSSNIIEVVGVMRHHSELISPNDMEKKMFLLYLINDVLHQCFRSRLNIDQLDEMSSAFLEGLGAILRNCYRQTTPVHQGNVAKLVNLWQERQIFNQVDILRLRTEMAGLNETQQPQPSAMPPPPSGPPPIKAPPSNTLHLTAGFIVDVVKRQITEPYTPLPSSLLPHQMPVKNPLWTPDPQLSSFISDFYMALDLSFGGEQKLTPTGRQSKWDRPGQTS